MANRFDRERLRPGSGRDEILDLLEAGFEAVDPAALVRRALSPVGSALSVLGEKLPVGERKRKRNAWVFAVGKAAVPMAGAAGEVLGARLAGGIAIAPYGYGGSVEGIEILEAGHPIPDANGAAAARLLERTAIAVRENDLVLCLLSGGGSALLASPPDGVSLDDLARTTRLLLGCGATIDEVNTVRRHLSTLQGGGLALRLRPATVRTLILSDVVGSSHESIASGPTVPDPTTFDDAMRVLRAHGLLGSVPPAVVTHIDRGACGEAEETAKPGERIFERTRTAVLADNETFVEAVGLAAKKAGHRVVRLEAPIGGEARSVGRHLGREVVELSRRADVRTVIVGGGETTVILRGAGRGGRNQELALAASVEIERESGILLASLATDGIDGPTDAAGAVADGETAALARRGGRDPITALAENDAYPALDAAGDLLFTGPTWTNVADVFIGLVDPARR
ncbi:glycerate kinase [Candidatus Bipolaricaulota bacterium]